MFIVIHLKMSKCVKIGFMKQMEKGKLGCTICGKGVQHTNLVSFSKRRIKHTRKPNLHTHHLVIDGTRVKVKLCTTCKRSVKLSERETAKATVANA